MTACHRCHRDLSENEGRPVPGFFKFLAGLCLGAVHAGMWIWEEFSHPYCAKCRAWLSFLTLVLAGLAAAGGFFALNWALQNKIFRR